MNRLALFGLAASVATFTACVGTVGEPLSATSFDEREATERNVTRVSGEGVGDTERAPVDNTETQPPGDDFRAAVLEEIAVTVGFAADVAFTAAEAGLSRDPIAARLAAADAQLAAETVQQRALEVMSATGEACSGCGCEGGDAPVEQPGDSEIDEAVIAALGASDATNELAGALDPPSEEVTSCHCGGCETTEVPGTIDETVLTETIDGVVEAGEGCAAAEDAINAL